MIEAREMEFYDEQLAAQVWHEESGDRNPNCPVQPYCKRKGVFGCRCEKAWPRYKDDLVG